MSKTQNKIFFDESKLKDALLFLCKYEPERKKYYTKWLYFMIFFSAFVIICLFLTFYPLIHKIMHPSTISFYFPLFIIGCPFLLFCPFIYSQNTKRITSEFSNYIKHEALEEILSAFHNIKWIEHKDGNVLFGDYTFDEKDFMKTNFIGRKPANSIIDTKTIEKSCLFYPFILRKVDDEFEGLYKNINFKISETTLTKNLQDIQYCDWDNIFKGVIITFDFNKTIRNHTCIETKKINLKSYVNSIIAFIFTAIIAFIFILCFPKPANLVLTALLFVAMCCGILKIDRKNLESTLQNKEEVFDKIILEDTKFNKRFIVFSTDEVEARYMITPSFMERLNNLSVAFDTNNIKCSFFENTFMLAINTRKNLFEIGKINKPLNDIETLATFYNELNSIYQMIEYFKLDEKTGI